MFVDVDGIVAWSAAPPHAPVRVQSFDDWAADHRGASARLVLSGRLLHSVRLREFDAAERRETLRNLAAERFALYHGAGAARWPIALASADDACFACALHGLDLLSLVDTAARREIDIKSAIPFWSEALASATVRTPAMTAMATSMLFVVEQAFVTCLAMTAGQLVDVQQRFLDAADWASLTELVESLAGSPEEPPGGLFVAGWGLSGPAADPQRWQVLGRLDGRVEGSAWLLGLDTAEVA